MELPDLLCCPTCRGALADQPDALLCPGCGREFEVIHGIPDFRAHPPGQPHHGDFCLKVIERWEGSSYRDLYALLHKDEPDALDRLWAEHEEAAPERGEQRWEQIRRAAEAAGRPLGSDGAALDIGCGLGSALFAMARHAPLAVGLDIMLTDLLLAKKRLLEAGYGNVAFVCASATELPLREGSFGALNATDVVEHMPDQRAFLAETRRVMAPGGCLFFNSPNRFSLLTPEPHVRLWGVGWLPRRWMEPYVRWRLGKPYRGKRLLSLFELRRLVRMEFGPAHAIWAFVPRGDGRDALRRLLGALARPLLPQHNVLAWKPAP